MPAAECIGDFLEEMDFFMQVRCVVRCLIFQSYLPLFSEGNEVAAH